MTDTTDLCTPWSLNFDRDGTEDVATIKDANGDLLACSAVFSLPVPLAAMRVMAAAPKLLAAAKLTLTQFQLILEMDDPQACTQIDWEAEPLASLRAAIAEAEGMEV